MQASRRRLVPSGAGRSAFGARDPTPGSLTGHGSGPKPPPVGSDDVAAASSGDFRFTLSANVPRVAFAGLLKARYAREWQTSKKGNGQVWISNQRLPKETYAEASIFVQPGYEYRVEICTSSNSGSDITAWVGGTTYDFDAGIKMGDCNLTVLLTSSSTGWSDIRVGYDHTGQTAFALDRIEVERTEV